jgi:hypothetical protein
MILFRCLLASLFLCLPLLSAAESNTAETAAQSLKGKLVFLRGMYVENDLAFDAQGNVTGRATPGPFSVSAIRIDKVHLDGTTMQLIGHRGGLIFTPTNSSKTAQLDFVEFSPEVHIRIAVDPGHPKYCSQSLTRYLRLVLRTLLLTKLQSYASLRLKAWPRLHLYPPGRRKEQHRRERSLQACLIPRSRVY